MLATSPALGLGLCDVRRAPLAVRRATRPEGARPRARPCSQTHIRAVSSGASPSQRAEGKNGGHAFGNRDNSRRQTAPAPRAAAADPATQNGLSGDQVVSAYLGGRVQQITQHFPQSLGLDDFIARLEMALFAFGFHGDNTIACSNLCRDEVTATLKHKLDAVFGSSFNTNGLGGVLTCGVTGMSAGLSHAPICAGTGKERYVFFSFPHIGIDSQGTVGGISRPGRPGPSSACGALKAALGEIQGSGLVENCKRPGVHEAKDPEYSILKQRLARRLRYEGLREADVQQMDLVHMTKVAERTITDDLEYLIGHAVDSSKADYAVVTGIQIHNWSTVFEDDSPNLEFVAPCSIYVVVNGTRTYLDLSVIPGMTPRQLGQLATARAVEDGAPDAEDHGNAAAGVQTSVRPAEVPYHYSSRTRTLQLKDQAERYKQLMTEESLDTPTTCAWPGWQSRLKADAPFRKLDDNSTRLDVDDGRVSAAATFEDSDRL